MFEISHPAKTVTVTDDRKGSIEFRVDSYCPSNNNIDYARLYQPVNDFLAREPAVTRAALFGYYFEAQKAILSDAPLRDLNVTLREVFAKIFRTIDIEKLDRFIRANTDIRPPANVPERYDSGETKFKRERTYDRSEYMDLITVIVALRFCIPIWGSYMNRISKTTSITKESYYAYLLLGECAILNTEAYKRLCVYVEAQINKSVDTNITTLVGIGKDEIPEWLMSNVVVRKLPVHNLEATVDKGIENAVATAHRAIVNQLKNPQTLLADSSNFRARQATNRDSDDGQEQSFIETYRSRTPAFYDIEINIVYLMSGIGKICSDYDPSFDPSIATEVEKVTVGIENIKLEEYHHILSLWIMDRMLLTVAPDTVEREVTANAMRVAQGLLHHWGLHNLALLATSERIDDGDGDFEPLGITFKPITVEMLDKLDQIYPWPKPGVSGKTTASSRPANYGYIAIKELAVKVAKYQYAVRVPSFLTSTDVDVDVHGRMYQPDTILQEFAMLLIKLDEI